MLYGTIIELLISFSPKTINFINRSALEQYMDDVFEEWNSYARQKKLKSRDINLESLKRNSGIKIVAVTGMRRSGKSSLLMLLHQKLREKNKVAYVNLEDSRIKDDKNVLDNVLKWFGDNGYLLLDEITSVNDWEGWLARNHEMLKGRLKLITSSSRKNLVVPAKPLRGRMLKYELYTLSFKEFMNFKGIKYETTTLGKGKVKKALEEFLIFGGFPEVVLTEINIDKIQLINSYFNDILGLDVSEISGENINVVETFGKYVIEAPYFSASKCLNYFKSLGYKIGKQSILDLEGYAQTSYLFFFTQIFSNNIKDRTQYPRKAYLGDTGFMNAISGKKDKGRLYENAVFLELKRRLNDNQEINYWKDKSSECDFVIREGLKVKDAMQVSYDIDNDKTFRREINGIVTCAEEFGLKKGIIITKDYESEEKHNKINLKFIPLWKWLIKEK